MSIFLALFGIGYLWFNHGPFGLIMGSACILVVAYRAEVLTFKVRRND